MSIRAASPADVPQMLHLERQATAAAHWSVEQYEALFLPDRPARTILVATDESSESLVLGFLVASSVSEEWEIESVVVDETVRRRGVGASLMQELVSRATTRGASTLTLEVRESNGPARQLYEKIGFIEECRRRDYYQGPLEHAILYRLQLQSCDKIP
jgi:[ribosomal protein S18]-alanine N-acetyltransferase